MKSRYFNVGKNITKNNMKDYTEKDFVCITLRELADHFHAGYHELNQSADNPARIYSLLLTYAERKGLKFLNHFVSRSGEHWFVFVKNEPITINTALENIALDEVDLKSWVEKKGTNKTGLYAVLDFIGDQLGYGAQISLLERHEQLVKHGFGAQRDDMYEDGQLAVAACQYIVGPKTDMWPESWDQKYYKPKQPGYVPDRIMELRIATALLMAEIDRLKRLEEERG